MASDFMQERPGETWVWILTPDCEEEGEDDGPCCCCGCEIPDGFLGVYSSLEKLEAAAKDMGLERFGILHAKVD